MLLHEDFTEAGGVGGEGRGMVVAGGGGYPILHFSAGEGSMKHWRLANGNIFTINSIFFVLFSLFIALIIIRPVIRLLQ